MVGFSVLYYLRTLVSYERPGELQECLRQIEAAVTKLVGSATDLRSTWLMLGKARAFQVGSFSALPELSM